MEALNSMLVGVAGIITAAATLVGSLKVIEVIMKARESKAKGETDNEIAANASITNAWQAAQEVQNRNIADIWEELNWLRAERDLDIEYIDELHAHIDELRDMVLTNGLKPPATPRRRKRTPPPARSRNPAEVLAELNEASKGIKD